MRINELHARTPSRTLILFLPSLLFKTAMAYAASGFGRNILIAAIMQPMQQIDPMISGSSGPINFAVKNHGTVNESAAVNVIPIIPFSARMPFPQIQTMKNGERNVKIH